MFGISGSEFFVLILVAVIVVGPQRLPEYARTLTRMVRRLRLYLDNARAQIAEEVGPELADLDLSDFDPRQYDPRRIVRDALSEDINAIREDLTHPFRSVAQTAREGSAAAAQAVNEAVRADQGRSLSRQVSEKISETRAQAAAAVAAENGTEDAQEDTFPGAGDVSLDPDILGSGVLDAVTEPGVGPGAADDDPADASPTQIDPAAEDPAEAVPDPQNQGSGQQPTTVPSTLVSAATHGTSRDSLPAGTGAGGGRPLSPREIVRAANEAARTRAEAAAVVLEDA
ncbi:Sec-independent protein translocase TatB [Actinomyces sp. 2119]|uniref:Sec-independent protein translocase protein TatB n=1 Tax=Actinomyces lilanjuaniae TaxID=2321394 RepID=A0ABM6Z392_9ACTO|nr:MULTISPECIES: twin-arginine translocase TatA/TatE family subunit [Actinomyces]AYD89454.1 Sec-independent protein translocase TatB [Actinomyces lilanjuaniae]RJF43190.1 Sec-independent protein translocase TatB [Actinomyces sp. 2119]